VKYLLDTNVCVVLLRNSHSGVSTRLSAEPPGSIALCAIVRAELLYGAERSAQTARNVAEVNQFVAPFPSLPFDDHCAAEYGALRAELERQGLRIGANDLFIAAIALANQLTLVTHNVAEFSRVPSLNIEDWEAATP